MTAPPREQKRRIGLIADTFPFAHTLRVRYAKIDGQKVDYNSHYLTYLDVAITEYVRSFGTAFLDASHSNSRL